MSHDHRRRQPECENDNVVLSTDRESLIMYKQQTEIAFDAGSRVPRWGAEMPGLQDLTAARYSPTEITFSSKTAGVQNYCGRDRSGHDRCIRIETPKSFHHVCNWTKLGSPILSSGLCVRWIYKESTTYGYLCIRLPIRNEKLPRVSSR